MDSWIIGAPEVTWGPEAVVTAFSPAQRSWEWVTQDPGHPGFARDAVNGGTACTFCHDGGFAASPTELGEALVGADEEPIPGKRGSLDVTLQAAYDDQKFYLKATWQTERPGVTHDIWTYQGGAWVRNSHEKPTVLAEGEVYSVEDRIAVMFLPASKNVAAGAGHPNNFHNVGCWVTCHVDLTNMPEEGNAAAYPYDPGGEITKYLKISRVGDGGYDAAATDTAALLAAGQFPDMWHFRGARSAAVQTLTDGYVMSTRSSDSGAHPYATNSPAPGNYMYDINVMGFHALPGDEWAENLENAPPLIVGVNAVPFDGNVVFNEGDILPRRRLSIPAADNRNSVRAFSSWADGVWTVIMVRDRDTGDARDHVLDPDTESYTFAFSIFEDFAGGRWHHVTLPVTLGTVGADVDIEAAYNN